MTTKTLTLRAIDIPSIHKFGIGFDSMLDELMRLTAGQTNTNYPPHNVIKTGEETVTIEVAVAGFGESDLDIKLGVLQISGKPKEFKRLSLTREYIINKMTNPLPAMEMTTQTDADGAFLIDVKTNDKYLLIIGQGNETLTKWFLKIDTLKKDGGKYLFSNQNSILSKDVKQVIDVSVDDSIKIIMNKNDAPSKK